MISVRVPVVLSVIVVICSCLSGCTAPASISGSGSASVSTPAPGSAGAILRVGTLFPATGSLAFIGPAEAAGVALAVADLNAAGGVNGAPVEVIARDSGDATTNTVESPINPFFRRNGSNAWHF